MNATNRTGRVQWFCAVLLPPKSPRSTLNTYVFAAAPPIPVLTGLRFFAAAEVVLYHNQNMSGSRLLRDLGPAGYVAVTFFFVLSGFILMYVYSDLPQRETIRVPSMAFWKARFARISPTYYLGLLAALPFWVHGAFTVVRLKVEQNQLFTVIG